MIPSVVRRGSTWLLAGLLAATTLVVLLSAQLRTMRQNHARLQDRERIPPVGSYLPRIDLQLTSGGRVTIGAPAARTRQLLFVYTTTCGFCLRSLPEWQAVTRRVEGLHVEVYGVSLDSMPLTRRYVEDHHLRFPTALLADPRSRALMRAAAVPQTLVVDSDGRVQHSRLGTLTKAGADSLVTLLARLEEGGGGAP